MIVATTAISCCFHSRNRVIYKIITHFFHNKPSFLFEMLYTLTKICVSKKCVLIYYYEMYSKIYCMY